MGFLLSAAPSSGFLCWWKWGGRIHFAMANGALTPCQQGLCGRLDDSGLKSKTWVTWWYSKTKGICPMVCCHQQLPRAPDFLSLSVFSNLSQNIYNFDFPSSACNSRGKVFLSFFFVYETAFAPKNVSWTPIQDVYGYMGTKHEVSARPQVRSEVSPLFRKENWVVEKPSQAGILVFSSDITFFLHVWFQENQHHHHWCQGVEWVPGTFGAGMPQPLLMCQQSPQWDRQSTIQRQG